MDITNPLILTLLISMGLQAFFFVFAATLRTDKVTDLSYGLSFIFIVWYLLFTNSNTVGIFEFLVASMIVLWGARLASYLVIRILKTGKDRRFDDMRNKPLKFAQFWLLQGMSVWLIMLPAVYMLTRSETNRFDSFALAGLVVWLFGLVVETVADLQLYDFRFNKDSRGKWIDEGLWHYSRHPNYFGEMLVWWGIFLYGISTYQGFGWLTVLGPMFITFLLLYVSGITLLEKSNDKRWGNDKNYQKYKKTTSLLLPIQKNSSGEDSGN